METAVQSVYYSGNTLGKTPHYHDCHQVILILRGEVEFYVNNTAILARAGDVAIFSRYENHGVRVRSEVYERYVLQIAPDAFWQNEAMYSVLTDRPEGFCNVISVTSCLEELREVFRRLLAEHGKQKPFAREMESLAVKELLILICRCMPVRFDRPADPVVAELKGRFERNCDGKYSLETLAEQYHISVSALSHRFRHVTGVSVMGYLQACRMAQAKRMLAETDLSVGEIVEACGFSDSSNFGRTFKKQTGISPTAFRKSIR